MPLSLPLLLIEPSSTGKRNTLIKQRLRTPCSPLDVESIKSELKTLRKNSVSKMDILVKKLKSNVQKRYGIKVIEAKNAVEAADAILRFSGSLRSVVINKSSTLQELMPSLLSTGFKVRESYYEESGDAGIEERKAYWELPELEPEKIWSSLTETVYRERYPNLKMQDGNWIGLLGVNAVSVEETSIYFLQHLHNISKILSEAKKIILVAGIEKIVQTKEEAKFQTMCDALFGLGSVMLDSFSYESDVKREQHAAPQNTTAKKARASLKSIPEPVSNKDVMLILLDNGRRNILHSRFKELLQCINCRACTFLCLRMRKNVKEGRSGRDIVLSAYTAGLEEAAKSGLYDCSLCGNCEANCPLTLSVSDMLLKLRDYSGKRKLHPVTYEKIASNINQHGNPYARTWRTSGHGR